MSNVKGRKRTMFSSTKQLMLSTAAVALVMSFAFAAQAQTTNINLAVASNFFGDPPINSAITDVINAFEFANPQYTVTVVDNGATATLAEHIIAGNQRGVDLFLAADTDTFQDLLINHFDLVAPYNSSLTPPLFTFNYATGILALLSNTPGVDLSCETGTCGYNPNVYATVGIAKPELAPYGVAAQTVLTGRYGLESPLSSNPLVQEFDNITLTFQAVIDGTVPVGFVAMSAICVDGKFPTSGTSALAYFSTDSTPNPGVLVYNYNPLTQAGIAIRHDRTPAQDTELEAFVRFMTDFTTAPQLDSPMMATLKRFCYNAP